MTVPRLIAFVSSFGRYQNWEDGAGQCSYVGLVEELAEDTGSLSQVSALLRLSP